MLNLTVQKRDSKVDLSDIRAQGLMPAVFYGKKEPATSISLSQVEFMKVYRKAGESSVVTLTHDAGSVDVLIHDVDFDPVTDMPRHADFYVFDKTHKLEIDVPLEYVGVASGVKDFGGQLVKVLHAIKIEALPSNLPAHIEVDLAILTAIGSQILAQDLKLPAGVTLVENAEEVVALVSAQKEETDEEALPVDLSAIEVEKKGKDANPKEEEVAETKE